MNNNEKFAEVCNEFLRKDLNLPAFEETDEKWIWITGYKGTDSDMMCRDYQFELGKQHDIPEGVSIKTCRSGFHLCLELESVFTWYPIGFNNRFFEVRALVRESDVKKHEGRHYRHTDKLAAKSIVLTRELSVDEIFATRDVDGWTAEDKLLALEKGLGYARNARNRGELLCMGYSERMVEYFIENHMTENALLLGSQEGLSMDTKIRILFNSNDD